MELASRIMYGVGSNLAKKNTDKAIKYFEKAIKINPNNEMAHFELGYCYCKLGDIERAEKEYEKAIQVYPGYGTAWDNLAGVYFQRGKMKEGQICGETGKDLPLTKKERKVENEYVRKIVEGWSKIEEYYFIEFDENSNLISFNGTNTR